MYFINIITNKFENFKPFSRIIRQTDDNCNVFRIVLYGFALIIIKSDINIIVRIQIHKQHLAHVYKTTPRQQHLLLRKK